MPEQIFEFTGNHPVLVVAFVSLLGFILFTEFRRFTDKFENIGPAAAISLINKENTILVDIREQNELRDGLINNAIHIPLSAIGKRVTELDKHKDAHVLVYCRSGNRSTSVCRTLIGRGFESVYNLSGGIMAWQDANLPVSKKKNKGKN